MASFARYKGARRLPGVRRPQVIADTAVGRGTEALGGQIQQSAQAAGQLAKVAAAHQYQIDDFERKRGLLDFSAKVQVAEAEAVANLQPGASGHERKMLGHFDKEAGAFLNSLPKSVRANAELSVKALRAQYQTKFAKTERHERIRYYQQGIAEGQDVLIKTIRSNPNTFDASREHGRKLILESGLTPIEKDAALKTWDNLASLAWAGTLPARERAHLFAGATVDAGSLIRAKEGFRAEAYWDVDHYRVGYGSDTVTRADGAVVMVTKDTVITRADGERDLERRVKEFQTIAAEAVGSDVWAALPPRVHAALTSITYNYGELPGRLHGAVGSGDLEQIATAIERLKDDNDGVNSGRRQEEADIVRGVRGIPNARPEVQERIDALTYDDQVKLALQAQRDLVTIAADRQDAYALEIVKDPLNVDRQAIIEDQILDASQKAVLLRNLDTAVKDGEAIREAIDWVNTEGKADPLDPDNRETADRAYKGAVEETGNSEAVAKTITVRKGVVPKGYVNEIVNGLKSLNPVHVQRAYERAMELYRLDESAVRGAENGKALEDWVMKWRVFREGRGLTAEEAAHRLAGANKPENIERRDALMKSRPVQDRLKEIDDDYVENLFDPGWLSWGPTLGATEEGRAVAVYEFKEHFRESLGETNGDLDAAEAMAFAQMSAFWGTSDYAPHGDSVVFKYPAEKLYDPVGGDHRYIGRQIDAKLAEEGIESDTRYLTGGPNTLHDLRAGRPPEMLLRYVDENGYLQELPFTADVEAAKAELKAKRIEAWAEGRARFETLEKQDAWRKEFLNTGKDPDGSALEQGRRAVEEFESLREKGGTKNPQGDTRNSGR